MRAVSSFFKALFLGVAIYFFLFFFFPVASEQYLGLSFRQMKDKMQNQLIESVSDSETLDAIKEAADPQSVKGAVVGAMDKAGNFTTEQVHKMEEALDDNETAERLKEAAKSGTNALERELRRIAESVEGK